MEFVLKFRLDSVSKFFRELERKAYKYMIRNKNKIIGSYSKKSLLRIFIFSLLRKLLHAFRITPHLFEILKMPGIIRR